MEEGGIVEGDNWFFPFDFGGILLRGEGGGLEEGDREFG